MSQAGGDGEGTGHELPVSFTMKVNEWKFRVNFTCSLKSYYFYRREQIRAAEAEFDLEINSI